MKSLLFFLLLLSSAPALAQVNFNAGGLGQPEVVFTQGNYDFNAEQVGKSNCVNLPLVNQSDRPRLLTALRSNLGAFTISSPAEEMLPLQLPPGGTMYVSVCFKPEAERNYNGRISAVYGHDSATMVVTGSGLIITQSKPITSYDLRVEKKNGSQRDFILNVDLLDATSIELTVSDALGKTVRSYTKGEVKAAGPYQFTFDGTDGNNSPLPFGKYFVKLIAKDFKSTKSIEITGKAETKKTSRKRSSK
jgi:hypothetical protein